jgi:hypothetical protein
VHDNRRQAEVAVAEQADALGTIAHERRGDRTRERLRGD